MRPWRRRRRRGLPRKLKTTGEGKLLIFVALGLGFAAINTGNNLLYLVLGMLLSLIAVSGVLSELTLRGVVVRRRYQSTVYAGRETFLTVELPNTKRRLSSFSVEVEEELAPGTVTEQRPGYALVLGPGERKLVALRIRFGRRGVHRSAGLRIATRFPFGFFRKWRVAEETVEIVAFPAVHPIQAPTLADIASGTVITQRRVGRGDEYHGLREHAVGDDIRDIHWKASARQGRLMTREYEDAADRQVWLLVPNAVTHESPAGHAAAEAGISAAASLASHYCDLGWAVGLRTLDGGIEAGTGPTQLHAILDHLARVPLHRPEARLPLSAPPRSGGARLLVRHASQREVRVDATFDRLHEVQGEAA